MAHPTFIDQVYSSDGCRNCKNNYSQFITQICSIKMPSKEPGDEVLVFTKIETLKILQCQKCKYVWSEY